jgi:flagellar M-ring protein FliF
MTLRLRELFADVAAFLAALPPLRRLVVVGAGAGSLVLVLASAWWVQRPVYRPLFTNLGADDAAAITNALAAERVAYRIEDGGRAVLVPADRLHALRLTLASRGLPAGGGVGFEIFDKPQLGGQTDFLQRLSYQRALQGELARTIGELGGVESARVHLALPERSLFVTHDRSPSASVVVKLARGGTLSPAQIDGIVHLVAASVQHMTPDAVTVVDESGAVLTGAGRADDALGAGGAVGYQRAIERRTEERIESLLATVVGPGKVIARVAATVDFSRTERTEETYDPDRTVLRESRATREGAGATRGGAAEAGAPRAERRDDTQRFEVSKTISHTVAPVGAVKSLSVAVLIDGSYREENGTRVFVPRPDGELERLKTLVASAVGFSEARGDRLEVTSAPFRTPEPEPAPSGLAAVPAWVPSLAARALGVVLVLGVLAVVVRPLVRTLGPARGGARPRLAAPVAEHEGAVGELARANVALVQQNPERAAQLLRQWLAESQPDGPPTVA